MTHLSIDSRASEALRMLAVLCPAVGRRLVGTDDCDGRCVSALTVETEATLAPSVSSSASAPESRARKVRSSTLPNPEPERPLESLVRRDAFPRRSAGLGAPLRLAALRARSLSLPLPLPLPLPVSLRDREPRLSATESDAEGRSLLVVRARGAGEARDEGMRMISKSSSLSVSERDMTDAELDVDVEGRSESEKEKVRIVVRDGNV